MNPHRPRFPVAAFLILATAAVAATGCQTVREKYYNAWEYVGYDKRERLVDDVQAASEAQGEARDQFVSALDRFKALTSFDGGDLEDTYKELNAAYTSAEARAADVRERIAAVENVSRALFDEWSDDIDLIEDDPKLTRSSEQLLERTRGSLDDVLVKMNNAADSMTPILTKFHNRVIFLKGQLNAQAIASLRDVELDLSNEIDDLIEEMEASIAEADRFIGQMQG
ncbi:DUF2959 domain-containing protein [Phycisphaera mikurensis]|uniref:DUF2959 domain-containing protein n=1 Tax=Phycisphaera mikurensis (strain NBRC 102666 / KCTC 22515 / FYK2301M01) TaxID=1142394 RepID=I0IFR2_PHYMF|nr:DUF2959 domain-containing protein [Phycisphaera mikurensis]MBB6440510.1 ABC-type transporter Mla subunit MlaD [Phycisphaera mikurensis]BAM04100.1 hypothetical protein PSMK_19410 [Phycisphaera mikurensis NBRC 102666]